MTAELATVAAGEAHLLQAGDCSERFDDFEARGADGVRDTFTLMVQMSILMMYGMRRPVVKIFRGAGQFTQNIEDVEFGESYRGDLVNSVDDPTADPSRMVKGHQIATAVINLLRTAAGGGQFDLHRIHDINLAFVRGTDVGEKFAAEADEIAAAISFMESVGVRTNTRLIERAEFYTAHECLLLEYEEALLRTDGASGRVYASSAHFLWVGDKTRDIDGAHVEFLSGISNPVGVKVGPGMTGPELVALVRKLNPLREAGKVSIITRFGIGKCSKSLPALIEAIQEAEEEVVWVCDPCHGNTVRTPSGIKTRSFESIVGEVQEFFQCHVNAGTHPGGVHLEMSGDDIVECTGGMLSVGEDDLSDAKDGQPDPRLNASQALELAFLLSKTVRDSRCIL